MKTGVSHEEVIVAGFGGQGIILTGKVLAQTAMKAGKEVTYMLSYGAEMRGGTANSTVIIDDEPIASPMVNKPNSLIAMSKAALNKFAGRLKSGGLVVMNISLIDTKAEVDETIEVLAIPADKLAVQAGNPKVANMVMLGAYLRCRGLFGVEQAAAALPDILAKRYHKTLPINMEALQLGSRFAEENLVK